MESKVNRNIKEQRKVSHKASDNSEKKKIGMLRMRTSSLLWVLAYEIYLSDRQIETCVCIFAKEKEHFLVTSKHVDIKEKNV